MDYNEIINNHNERYAIDGIGFAVACVGTERVRYLKQTGESSEGPITDWTTDERDVTGWDHPTACKALNRAALGTRLYGYCRLVVIADPRDGNPLPTVNGY